MKLLVNFLALLLISFSGWAQAGYDIKLTQAGPTEWMVEVTVSDYQIEQEMFENETRCKVIINGAPNNNIPGRASLPFLHRLLQVPENAVINATIGLLVTDTLFGNHSGPVTATPYRQQDPDQAPRSSEPITLSSFMKCTYSGKLRAVPVADLQIPLALDVDTGIIILRKLTGVISLDKPIRTKASSSVAFDPLYRQFIENYTPEKLRSNTSLSAPAMLIVTHDDLYSAMEPFLKWKRQQGYRTQMIRLSEITSFPDEYAVKQYVRQMYQQDSIEYLLLVGDHDKIPVFYGVGNSLNDHGYTTVDGPDFFPDLIVGRFSVNSPAECRQWVNKTIRYEQYTGLSNSGWENKAMTIASNDGVDDFNGKQMSAYFQSKGYAVADDYRELLGNNTIANVNTSLNEGRGFVFYIGHGTSNGWMNVQPAFTNQDIQFLQNDYQWPAIVSVACANADIDDPKDCFSEEWMNDSVNGASIVLSASENCAFFYTDTLGKYATFGYMDRQSYSFGSAMNFGKMAMYDAYPEPAGSLTEETMEQFLILGDPTMLPYTEIPQIPIVEYSIIEEPASRKFELHVSDGNGPVHQALIGLSNLDGDAVAGVFTDSAGIAIVHRPLDEDSLWLTISGYNLIPYQEMLVLKLTDIPERDISFQIYPNPANDLLYINWSGKTLEEVAILSMTGQKVMACSVNNGENKFHIGNLPAGIYVVRVIATDGTSTSRKISKF